MVAFGKIFGLVALLALFLLVDPGPSAGQPPVSPDGPSWWWYADYLRGGSDVIRSQAYFMVEQQKALFLREKVRQEKLNTRRQHIEQWLWEIDEIPSIEDLKARWQAEAMKRAFNDPPLTEIWSAKPLNDMLQHVIKTRSPGDTLGSEALTSDTLLKINVTNGKASSNAGLLKDGKIQWPLLLRRDYFNEDRDRLDELVAKTVNQAIEKKPVDVQAMSEIIARVKGLHDSLRKTTPNWSQLPDWSPTLYMDAKSFVIQFDDAVRALQQPDAYQYLGGLRAPEGQNVADLVAYMKNNGLFFAPASPGSETAYTALYRSLRTYAAVGPVLKASPPK